MEGALKWRGGKSGQRYFQQREGRAGVVVVSLTRRAKSECLSYVDELNKTIEDGHHEALSNAIQHKEEIFQLESETALLKEENKELHAEAANFEAKIETLQQEVEQLKTEAARLRSLSDSTTNDGANQDEGEYPDEGGKDESGDGCESRGGDGGGCKDPAAGILCAASDSGESETFHSDEKGDATTKQTKGESGAAASEGEAATRHDPHLTAEGTSSIHASEGAGESVDEPGAPRRSFRNQGAAAAEKEEGGGGGATSTKKQGPVAMSTAQCSKTGTGHGPDPEVSYAPEDCRGVPIGDGTVEVILGGFPCSRCSRCKTKIVKVC